MLQSRQNFVLHEAFHLERNARHGDKNRVVLLEPHARGGAVCIVQDGALFGHQCLVFVQLVDGHIPSREHLGNMLQNLLVHHQPAVEIAAQNFFGDIIFCGSQSPGNQYQIGSFFCFGYCLQDLVVIVVHRGDLINLNAAQIELLAHPGRVGIDHLPNQYFIANGDNFSFHCSCFLFL